MLIARIVFIRLLYKHSEHLGINPGEDFENWIKEDILEPNGIKSVNDLKTKLDLEESVLKYRYETCTPAPSKSSALGGETSPRGRHEKTARSFLHPLN